MIPSVIYLSRSFDICPAMANRRSVSSQVFLPIMEQIHSPLLGFLHSSTKTEYDERDNDNIKCINKVVPDSR